MFRRLELPWDAAVS